ncbi:hypothetical protein BGY98DRAFT_935382 [Russula aff. rugulosa BPL654]|nr:hypothetical protein BGY98DRAFT_935382 [Russula aff. rugulosa BPL654]
MDFFADLFTITSNTPEAEPAPSAPVDAAGGTDGLTVDHHHAKFAYANPMTFAMIRPTSHFLTLRAQPGKEHIPIHGRTGALELVYAIFVSFQWALACFMTSRGFGIGLGIECLILYTPPDLGIGGNSTNVQLKGWEGGIINAMEGETSTECASKVMRTKGKEWGMAALRCLRTLSKQEREETGVGEIGEWYHWK